jgi:aldose 1-epimerase
MIPPSGRQVALTLGDQRAVITEVGAGLRRYDVGTWTVVDGYELDELCSDGRGQLLVPWPNRVGDGRYRFGGHDHQLPLDEPQHCNAIHGLVRWEAWEITQPSPSTARASYCLHPRPGYPFHLELRVDYDLTDDDGLAATVRATNLGPDPAPYGAGWHPYLSVGTPEVDDATVQIPAEQTIPTDDRGIPCGDPVPVTGTAFDFREARRIGDTVLDTCYTELGRDADGFVRARLSGPDGGSAVELWADGSVGYLMVFTGDTLDGRRRQGVAIEPMTCPPDAFRSGRGLIVLEPGETSTSRWGIQPFKGTLVQGRVP